MGAQNNTQAPGMAIGIAAGLGAGAFWGMTFVAPLVVEGFTPLDFTVGRFVACGLFALLWLAVVHGRSAWQGRAEAGPTAAQMAAALGLSVLGYTGYYWLLVLAIEDAGAALPVLIIGTIPLWIMLLGKPQGLRWRTLLPGMALTAAGMGLMMHVTASEGDWVSGEGHWLRGVAFAVAAMASWTAFGLLNARWLKQHPEVNSTVWANWLGVAAGVGAWLMWWALGSGWGHTAEPMWQREGWGLFVLVCSVTGIGSAWIAAVLWNMASRRLPESLAGQLIVSETVFGLVYAFAWSGQWPVPLQGLACVLFVLGILASIRAHR
jgi:drug/metabolite transporter (DMT)-like permease